MINFLCTSPEPNFKSTDALYNEIHLLQKRFKGNVTSLNPSSTLAFNYPILLYGVHNFSKIRALDKANDINHIYASSIFHLPIIHFLKKPIIYSIFAGIDESVDIPKRAFMKRILKFVVSNERDFKILTSKGLSNVVMVRPAIDTQKFEKHRLPLDNKLNFLMASAPWEMKQFETKGIHLLLTALRELPNVHITFLWRNIFPEHMQALIKQYNVEDKTTFINEISDVSLLQKKVHGTLLLTNDCTVVKAYPSSIVESIVSGKPVIVSQEIPIADFVTTNNYGLVLEDFSVESLITAIKDYRHRYHELSNNTLQVGVDEFSKDKMLKEYERIYHVSNSHKL